MPSLSELQAQLPDLGIRDAARLRKRLAGVRRIAAGPRGVAVLAEIANEIDAAKTRIENRRNAVPKITYPIELPISQRKDEILTAIRDHQVVVIAGETGSGKTTQLPKICLELGRGIKGSIGHTQPRRIAARAVADRIASELEVRLGEAVGYQVRFAEKLSTNTLIKVMTDGVLLAEIVADRNLSKYDTIVIDEAHERSLNIDFLLGYLRELLPRRPELKVIITSATIDPDRFARYFNDAPIIEVSGRTYPVEVRYRPSDVDQFQAICDGVTELIAEGPGDILVFLSGEREIRDATDALARMKLANTEILPLFARLSAAEQQRVFANHTGRRIVLATNVAETSLTVPGIRFVIDVGTARISRYSQRLKVQQLPIEPISQASANQRAGRCGRTEAGICLRLYSEDDFTGRDEFTDPEIIRTSLAAVILQMAALGLGQIADFPFLDPPDRRQVTAGVRLLHELGALELRAGAAPALTKIGRRLAALPVDPRWARMVVEADRNGCLHEVLVIVAALSIIDPRERPADAQEAAQQSHARFADERSDFLSVLNLWNYLKERQRELSSSQFRRQCKAEFLNYVRIREWQDIVSQLRQISKNLGMTITSALQDSDRIHQSLMAGLLSHLGVREGDSKGYLGARGAKFAIAPGSVLFKQPPRWTMVAELVETSRLWGRIAARIAPEWAERLGEHLIVRSYSEPRWDKKQGAVVANEKVTLFGLPLVVGRRVNYGRVDPGLARELFIRHALVAGEWRTHHTFYAENASVLAKVQQLEDRLRRRDIGIDDEALFEFYDRHIPAEVISTRHFDSWWKKAQRHEPRLLNFSLNQLLATDVVVDAEQFPEVWSLGELRLPIRYVFQPDDPRDGVTVQIPLAVLNQVPAEPFSWQIPGLRAELVTALLRSLRKDLRRELVPIPDTAAAVLDRLSEPAGSLVESLSRELRASHGVAIRPQDWRLTHVPPHLLVSFEVVDESGKVRARGRELTAIKRELADLARGQLAAAREGIERTGIRDWDFGTLPSSIRQRNRDVVSTGYPSLVDEKDSVSIRLLDTEAAQQAAMWAGTRRLLILTTGRSPKQLLAGLSRADLLMLSQAPHGSLQALLDDCLAAVVDHLLRAAGGPVWEQEAFATLRSTVAADLVPVLEEVLSWVGKIVTVLTPVREHVKQLSNPALALARSDIEQQLAGLVSPGFVSNAGIARLPDIHRYLRAIAYRLERLPQQPGRDAEKQAQFAVVFEEYLGLKERAPGQAADAVTEVRWMLEELRVSLFAQPIPTAYRVSDVRVFRAIDAIS